MIAEQDNDTGNNLIEKKRLSIGARLSAARKKHKLAVEKVASELNLDAAIVVALEQDNKDDLPAPIFVQGYLRNYARLVGLPEDELVKDYTEHSGELPPLAVVDVSSAQPVLQLPSGKLIRNIIIIVLVIFMAWLAYPYMERLITSREQTLEEQTTDHLELPPANQMFIPAE